jgi:hypothetical protein
VTIELNPKQALFLFGLLFGRTDTEREPMQSKTRPDLDSREREALVKAGLLDKERRGRATHLLATDACWQWASTHLGAPLSKSAEASPVLRNLLTQLEAFLEARGLALGDLFAPAAGAGVAGPDAHAHAEHTADEHAEPDGTNAVEADTRARILSTLLALGGGRAKQRVRLAALRERLAGVSRRTVDATLLELQHTEQLVLYRLDNPTELTPADDDAALLVAGQPRHLVYLES